ncbi:MAG: CHAT domain-containing protein [Prevotella sp.]|nr:CHAT domain-containing protein [Prevotella sp.]
MRRLVLFGLLLLFIGYTHAQVVENPVFDRTDVSAFRVQKIEIRKDTTYVYCSYSAEAGSWANISKDAYLYVRKANKKYPLLRCEGLPFSPQKKSFMYEERCNVLLCFPPIRNISKFDIIENAGDKAFNIYGIDISNTYETSYQESEVARYSNMASFYDSVGDTIKALQFKAKEIEATKYVFGVKSESLIVSLLNASIMYDKYGFCEQAIDIAKQEGEIHAELWGTSDWNYALYLRTLGQFYSHAKEYNNAILSYKESIQLYESLKIVDNAYALALYFLAGDYYEIGDSDNALFYQKKTLEARRQIGEAEGYITELYNVLLEGHDQAILNRVQIVKNELNTLPGFIEANSLPIAGIYKQIASMYSLMDDNTNAIEYCDKAISIMNSTGNNSDENYAELLGLKCKYQQRSGLKDDAIASGEAAKRLYESLGIKSLNYAELLGDLAWAYGLALNYEKSVQLQSTAAEIYQNAKDWISLAEVYNSISHYYQSAERLDNAEQYIKKAIDVLNEHDNAEQYIIDAVEQTGNSMMNNPFALASIKQRIDTDKSNFLQTLARIYQKQGNYADAINSELDNGKILIKMGDTQMYATHLLPLSEYYLRNGQLQEAIACSEQSIQLLNDNKISVVLPKLLLAFISFQTGDTIKAIRFAEESVSAAEKEGNIESKLWAQYMLSYFYWKNHVFDKAEQFLSDELFLLKNYICNEFEGMTTEQKQRLWNNYEHHFLMYRCVIEKSDRNATLLSKLYDYILFSKSLLLDTEIKRNANKASRLNIKWKDVQQHLSNDAIAIEFIYTIEEEGGHNTYHALVVDKKNPCPKMITLYSESMLEEIKKTETRNIRDIVGELIWKPILVQYPTVKDIYFSPDGILHMLPIEYYSADGMSSMFEQYHMYRLSSTKELVREKGNSHPNSAVLYGGLDYNMLDENSSVANSREIPSVWRGIAERGGFDPLFNTALETQKIKDLLAGKNISTTLYSGEFGTEESFRNLSGQSHSIIHLATHGMYINPDDVDTKKNENNFDFLESLSSLNDPVNEDITLTHSFLVMAGGNRVISRISVSDKNNDGILTSKEISQLDLRRLDLVVLSACESALGDINNGGVYGLQRGFKKSGANTIVMSLDKVDDEATRILMVEFYRNLMNGKTKRQSLQDAQQRLRKVENGKYDDPRYWASFIMLDGLN